MFHACVPCIFIRWGSGSLSVAGNLQLWTCLILTPFCLSRSQMPENISGRKSYERKKAATTAAQFILNYGMELNVSLNVLPLKWIFENAFSQLWASNVVKNGGLPHSQLIIWIKKSYITEISIRHLIKTFLKAIHRKQNFSSNALHKCQAANWNIWHYLEDFFHK